MDIKSLKKLKKPALVKICNEKFGEEECSGLKVKELHEKLLSYVSPKKSKKEKKDKKKDKKSRRSRRKSAKKSKKLPSFEDDEEEERDVVVPLGAFQGKAPKKDALINLTPNQILDLMMSQMNPQKVLQCVSEKLGHLKDFKGSNQHKQLLALQNEMKGDFPEVHKKDSVDDDSDSDSDSDSDHEVRKEKSKKRRSNKKSKSSPKKSPDSDSDSDDEVHKEKSKKRRSNKKSKSPKKSPKRRSNKKNDIDELIDNMDNLSIDKDDVVKRYVAKKKKLDKLEDKMIDDPDKYEKMYNKVEREVEGLVKSLKKVGVNNPYDYAFGSGRKLRRSKRKSLGKKGLRSFGRPRRGKMSKKLKKLKRSRKKLRKFGTNISKVSKKQGFGKIYGLQTPEYYTGVYPLAEGLVPKTYMGDPMNRSVNLPNLYNVDRSYPGPSGAYNPPLTSGFGRRSKKKNGKRRSKKNRRSFGLKKRTKGRHSKKFGKKFGRPQLVRGFGSEINYDNLVNDSMGPVYGSGRSPGSYYDNTVSSGPSGFNDSMLDSTAASV
jgi:hypothetical protein